MTSAPSLFYKSFYTTLIAGSVFVALEATGITSFIGEAEAASAQCEQVSVEKTETFTAPTPVITLVDVTSSHGVIADILKQSDL